MPPNIDFPNQTLDDSSPEHPDPNQPPPSPSRPSSPLQLHIDVHASVVFRRGYVSHSENEVRIIQHFSTETYNTLGRNREQRQFILPVNTGPDLVSGTFREEVINILITLFILVPNPSGGLQIQLLPFGLRRLGVIVNSGGERPGHVLFNETWQEGLGLEEVAVEFVNRTTTLIPSLTEAGRLRFWTWQQPISYDRVIRFQDGRFRICSERVFCLELRISG